MVYCCVCYASKECACGILVHDSYRIQYTITRCSYKDVPKPPVSIHNTLEDYRIVAFSIEVVPSSDRWPL